MLAGDHKADVLRARKWRRRDHEAVASVIGTIFALMIFMSLLTLLVTAFVPAWEKSNEQDFLNTAIFQMSQVKSANLELRSTGDALYVPFNMAPDRVPLFGKNYLGSLEYRSGGEGASSMNISFNSGGLALHTNSTGTLAYTLLNAYSSRTVVYEHGGVVLTNIDDTERNSVFKSTPSISFTTNANGTIDLQVTQIDFVGSNDAYTSAGTVGLTMTLTETRSQQEHMVSGGNLSIQWVSTEAGAWEHWAITVFGMEKVQREEGSDVVTLSLTNVNRLQYTLVKTQMVLE